MDRNEFSKCDQEGFFDNYSSISERTQRQQKTPGPGLGGHAVFRDKLPARPIAIREDLYPETTESDKGLQFHGRGPMASCIRAESVRFLRGWEQYHREGLTRSIDGRILSILTQSVTQCDTLVVFSAWQIR